jgi:hypothetical protein
MVEFLSVKIEGKIFLPKSMLNAFRRAFYAKVLGDFAKGGRKALSALWKFPVLEGKNKKFAVISDDFEGITCDVAIWKANDFSAPIPESLLSLSAEKYLYLPPFHSAKDIEWAKDVIRKYSFDGLYAENYDGVKIAEELSCKLFAGTGFNLTNLLSVAEMQDRISYYAVSKELSETEAETLRSDKSFALAYGDIKIMDLCYCPFEKTCNRCDQKTLYRLTDENGRTFPVRRYVDGMGACRFEVYNCASLVGKGVHGMGKLTECTVQTDKTSSVLARTETEQKAVFTAYTSGHNKNGVL